MKKKGTTNETNHILTESLERKLRSAEIRMTTDTENDNEREKP